jgi:hypothetical protein
LELARRLVETLEDQLKAETIKGPNDTPVADNMARMRAVEAGIALLGMEPARKTEGKETTVLVQVNEARWLADPAPQPHPVEAAASQVRVLPAETEDV